MIQIDQKQFKNTCETFCYPYATIWVLQRPKIGEKPRFDQKFHLGSGIVTTSWEPTVAHTVVRPCPAIIGGEESCKTSSSAGPWCWPRPRHRGQRIPTVPSRIGPVEVDFVLVRHFSGCIFYRPSSTLQSSRTRMPAPTLRFPGA